jgi:hypothetical protein
MALPEFQTFLRPQAYAVPIYHTVYVKKSIKVTFYLSYVRVLAKENTDDVLYILVLARPQIDYYAICITFQSYIIIAL